MPQPRLGSKPLPQAFDTDVVSLDLVADARFVIDADAIEIARNDVAGIYFATADLVTGRFAQPDPEAAVANAWSPR